MNTDFQITELSSFEIDETNGGLPKWAEDAARWVGAIAHELLCTDH